MVGPYSTVPLPNERHRCVHLVTSHGICQVRLKCEGTKLAWDDWHCDHKTAWSAGGKTTVENGIVANGLGPTAADFPLLMTEHNPTRHTAMLDWSPTEFSRLRLQFASDKSRFGVTDHQALLQYIFSLGAHGAHKF